MMVSTILLKSSAGGRFTNDRTMKGYRIKVVAQITLNVTKDEFDEDNSIGLEFNKFNAVMYATGCLVERLRNNPHAGIVKIEEFEYE